MPDLRGQQTHLGATLLDGRYRLGPGRWEGAVGVVREAYDTRAGDRRVVIKHPDPYQGPEARAYRERLLDVEANALGLLKDVPHVCRVLAQGRVGHGPGSYRYLVIEWADGEPVINMLQSAAAKGKSLPIGTSLLILTQLGHVLAEAHRNGLINNDVDIKHLYWNNARASLKMIDWGNAKTSSSPDWGRFGYRDDLLQYADVMFCLLTGRAALDVKQADPGLWRESFSEVLDAVQEDLYQVGSRLTSHRGSYESGVELYDDLEGCLSSLRDYMRGDLETVDHLLGQATPESISKADKVLKGLCRIAPVDPSVVKRLDALSRLRRERKEAAAVQLGRAYVKAGSWLDAVEVLSKTFGHDAKSESDPALLLAAAKLVDSRRGGVSKTTQRHWAAGARAISDGHYDEALDCYLAARAEWLDTKVEPVRSLLTRTGRYVLRHELAVVDGALTRIVQSADRGNWPGGNSRHGSESLLEEVSRARRELHEALEEIRRAGEHDWGQQRRCYRRIAKTLESCANIVPLPDPLLAEVREVGGKAREVVRLIDRADRALSRLNLAGAAAHMECVPKHDPDNLSAIAQARVLRQLQPTFDRIHDTNGWRVDIASELEQRALSDIEDAYASLPGSTLKQRVISLARRSARQVAAAREAEMLEEGLALLRERRWQEASRWARRVRRDHPRWEDGAYVSRLADAYGALYDRRQPSYAARERVVSALKDLERLTSRDEELRQHKKRLEAIAECSRHLFAAEEEERALAPIAIENLPADDTYREQILPGIGLTRSLREAVRDGEWGAASEAAASLASANMPIMSLLAADWREALAEAAEGMTHRESRRYARAIAHFDAALSRVPSVDLGRPAPLAREVQKALGEQRDDLLREKAACEQDAEGQETGTQQSATKEAEVDYVEAMTHSIQDGCSRLSSLLKEGQIERGRDVGDALRSLICRVTEHLHRLVDAKDGRSGGHAARGEDSERGTNSRVSTVKRPRPRNGSSDPKRQAVEPLGWAMGGAAVIVVVLLVLVLALGRGASSDGSLTTGASVEEHLAQITDLLEAGDREGASALYGDLLGQDLAGVTGEQYQSVVSIGDYLWLWDQSEIVTDETLREDLLRLERLWGAYQAGQIFDEEASGAAIESATRKRWDYLQARIASGTVEAYETAISVLEGLEDSSLSGIISPLAFRNALAGAYASLGGILLDASDCAGASNILGRLTDLVSADPGLAEATNLVGLTERMDVCSQSQNRCQVLAAMAMEENPEHPGDDLQELSRIWAQAGGASVVCDGVTVEQLVSSRLATLAGWLEEGGYAAAAEEALKVREGPWFSQPPTAQQPSPAEIVISAYALWTQQACSQDECSEREDALISSAQEFYAQYENALAADARERIEGLLVVSRESCAACRDRASSQVPRDTESRSLLDDTLGAWTNHGIYYGNTAEGRAYHLNDVFLMREIDPILYGGEQGASRYDLYTTNYVPADDPLQGVVALHVKAKVLSVKGLDQESRPLWGVRVPGAEADAQYIIALWTPDRGGGRWSLVRWVPSDGVATSVELPQEAPDTGVELSIVLAANAMTYDVYWQGEQVLNRQSLPAPAPQHDMQFVIGQGVHVWIQDARIETLR